jgi:hypothetical protein
MATPRHAGESVVVRVLPLSETSARYSFRENGFVATVNIHSKTCSIGRFSRFPRCGEPVLAARDSGRSCGDDQSTSDLAHASNTARFAKTLGICEFRNLARFDTLQAYYSIAGRDLEREIVPLLQSEKVGLLVWSPLAGGLLSGKYSRMNQKPTDSRRTNYDFPIVDKERAWKILDVMAPIAKAHGCSPARLSIAWLLGKPAVTSVIIGAKRLDQLQDNLAAAELILTQDEFRRLDEVSVLLPEYPGWVLPFQGADRLEPVDRWERFHEAKKPH